jgi:hypothetical protein
VYATYHFYSIGGLEAALAVPVMVALVYGLNEVIERTDWWPSEPERVPLPEGWLEEADASHRRGTGISTLAVRYDVEPDWLEAELSRFASTPRT